MLEQKISKRMKTILKKFICVLLILIVSSQIAIKSVYAIVDHNRIEFSTRLEVNDGFSYLTPNHKSWKEFLEKFKLSGYAIYKDLFTVNEQIYMASNIYLNNRFLLDLDYTGNQQFYYIGSNALNEKLHFNGYNYYEFMLKGYFFLNLPTPKIALLTYPYGLYMAYKPINDFLIHYVDPIKENTTIPYKVLLENISGIKSFFDKQYLSYQITRSATIESGITDLLYYDFSTADQYLTSFAENKDLHINVDGDTKTFEIAGYEIIKYTKNDKENTLSINLPPSPNGISYVATVSSILNSNGNYDLTAHLSLQMDGSDYFNVKATGTDLPSSTSAVANGNIQFIMSGDGLGKTEELNFSHILSQTKDNKFNFKLSYIEPKNHTEAISMIIDGQKKHIEQKTGMLYKIGFNDEDFFSLNDQSLKSLKNTLKSYIKKVAIPMLIETPDRVIDDLFDLLEANGLLNVLMAK